MRIESIVSIVDSRQYAPAAVHLRIVLVDFRYDKKYWKECQREGKGRYQWIR